MLSRDVLAESPDLHAVPGAATSIADRYGRRSSGFASLSRTDLSGRFAPWLGRSGKSYVFSVYAASDCPAFCDAVLIAATRDETGRRRPIAVIDTGAFPEPALDRVRRDAGAGAGALELHVHLLSRSAAERREAIADLTAVLFPCSR